MHISLRQTSFEDTDLDNMDLLTSTALVKFFPCGHNEIPCISKRSILLAAGPSSKLMHLSVLKLAGAQQILQDVLQERATLDFANTLLSVGGVQEYHNRPPDAGCPRSRVHTLAP